MPPRRPLETKRRILDAAFWEVYRNGFQGASIDRILEGTGITKGALFHHFPSKQHLGHAIVDGPIQEWIGRHWLGPLADVDDPIAGIPARIRAYLDAVPEEIVHGGCPLGNLTHEMASIDEGFRLRLEAVASGWRSALADLWRRGQANGRVASALDPDDLGAFSLSVVLGILGTAKAGKDRGLAHRATAVFARALSGFGQ